MPAPSLLACVAVLIGIGVAVLSEPFPGPPMPLGARLAAGGAATLVCLASLRRPVASLVVGSVLHVVAVVWSPGVAPMIYVLVFVTYEAAASSRLPLAVVGATCLAATAIGSVVALTLYASDLAADVALDELLRGTLDGALITAVVVVVGRQARALRAANEELDALRVVERDHAVAEERRQIAVELHDIAAHHLSAMAVRAKVALRTGSTDDLREATRTAANTASESLGALQQLVHVLRNSGSAPLAPQAGLIQLPDVVARVTAAGLDVELDVPSPLPDLDSQSDLAAVRIIQESLTNALRHGGTGPVTVVLRPAGDDVCLRVVSALRPASGAQRRRRREGRSARGGRGLIGMQERAHACGGVLSAGPTDAGRWLVEAWLPMRGAG
ncbi:MAG: sensor histidine kinase [Acidimicrobiales bacterium]